MQRHTIHKIVLTLALAFTFGFAGHALAAVDAPSVRSITSTSAELYLSPETLATLSGVSQSTISFSYAPTQQVCIMIYPTPASCLPKQTAAGVIPVTIKDLQPATSYTVTYIQSPVINCLVAPCPTPMSVASKETTFTTLAASATDGTLTKNLSYRMRGAQVTLLQDLLRAKGYFSGASTGYFGIGTFKAVKAFQKSYMHIAPTGYVGVKTRAALSTDTAPQGESFEGTIQSVSTACFSDGECSVTIDGKKVVTTIGWSQQTVGVIKGTVNSIGDIETTKIGAHAKVYAQKLSDGSYTLYGSTAYYIEVQ